MVAGRYVAAGPPGHISIASLIGVVSVWIIEAPAALLRPTVIPRAA